MGAPRRAKPHYVDDGHGAQPCVMHSPLRMNIFSTA